MSIWDDPRGADHHGETWNVRTYWYTYWKEFEWIGRAESLLVLAAEEPSGKWSTPRRQSVDIVCPDRFSLVYPPPPRGPPGYWQGHTIK